MASFAEFNEVIPNINLADAIHYKSRKMRNIDFFLMIFVGLALLSLMSCTPQAHETYVAQATESKSVLMPPNTTQIEVKGWVEHKLLTGLSKQINNQDAFISPVLFHAENGNYLLLITPNCKVDDNYINLLSVGAGVMMVDDVVWVPGKEHPYIVKGYLGKLNNFRKIWKYSNITSYISHVDKITPFQAI